MTTAEHPPPGSAAPAHVPMHCLHFEKPGPPRPTELPDGSPAWLVSRYPDVRQVLSDPRFGRARLYADEAPSLFDAPDIVNNPDLMFNQDGPDHLRLRRTLRRAFTPRAVARWRPWITEIVEQLLDGMAREPRPADVVETFTFPLPVAVISRLMGLDPSVRGRLRHWTEHAFSDGSHEGEQVESVLREFSAFGAALLDERRRAPGDDLISGLVRAADEEGDIPEAQLVSLVCGLVVGGHDSTMTMLGNGLLYLLGERPDAWRRLGTDEEAAGTVADRLIHLVPLGDDRGSARHASAQAVIGGVTIPAGAVVLADCGMANRDPDVFPSRLADGLFTPLEAPTLSFGAGAHYCLGAWLARVELQIALHRLAARFPDLRLAEPVDAVTWRTGSTSRSPQSLRVTW
ncbi:cytochrome P450 [Streptomyces sp. SID8360]|nr:cytochrome P450 [Streptomyces sp. SirexAA-E]MYR67879.1 cytochrome P450 [Streptomyces sp. SID4939]MYT67778.1 cytochrome P450 [Streptomyces sp. SID8357]MYT86622.1 cytochrome P450 [Streptomyces sp. SID8360]MYW41338.1 cytochrome P450 [Streptomyces sp. SID1]PZX37519.1 cytochrome P450 [Streptomyces sp. DvalAA-21]RAJ33788.1 cytochrome P450 [Streptomyces sp. DpondAA-E10]RAJ48272.1 cytochrome P450 [Streptomyces sp. DpondAA-A50]SCM07955.1 Cytochrome P450 [Streptomyces sp. DpondAA-F4]